MSVKYHARNRTLNSKRANVSLKKTVLFLKDVLSSLSICQYIFTNMY